MKRALTFAVIGLITIIILLSLTDTPPLPKWPEEAPRKLGPKERRDSVRPGKRIGNG